MSSFLYIDSAQGYSLGLWHDKENVFFLQDRESKSSRKIHFQIYENLARHGYAISANSQGELVQNLIFNLGPGSYTGIRVAKGMMDAFELHEGFKVYGIYSFEIPFLAGSAKYSWVAKAFKNEIFVYQREGDVFSSRLMSKIEFQEWKANEGGEIYGDDGETFQGKDVNSLLKKDAPALFSKLIQGGTAHSKEPFYFRPLDEEFIIRPKAL